MSNYHFDVAVVGAGVSGLAAAEILLQSEDKLRICIVEARHRIGGRLETTTTPHGLDVGGQWIGPGHTELLRLVQKYHLTLEEQYYCDLDSPAATKTTQRLTECVGFAQLPLDAVHQTQVQNYMDLLEQLVQDVNVNAPWRHPKANDFDNTSWEDHIRDNIDSVDGQNEVVLFAQTLMASRPESVSFLFALFYLASGGGLQTLGDGPEGAQKWKLQGGMVTLYDCMKRDILARRLRAFFLLDSPVERVTWDPQYGCAQLYTRGGQRTIFCRHVIFAVAPMLLSNIQFSPPLSPNRQALIQAMVGGMVIKVILTYDRAFWLQPQPPSADSQMAFFNGPLHNIFHGRGTTLVGLITGACAESFLDRQDDFLQECIVMQIQAMYQVTDQPLQVIMKRWAAEEFSRGCFAGLFPPGGSFSKLGRCLRAREGSLHWASTETATCWYGYVEGAILAGQRAGREVLSAMAAAVTPSSQSKRERLGIT